VKEFSRWPLAMLGFGLITVAVALDLTNTATAVLAGAIEVLGIAVVGAFIYAEGARHREWIDHNKPDPDKTQE
jgi:hypothetical protein